MITKELIRSFIGDKLSADDVFLVEISVSPTNRIYVEIDSFQGVNIAYCVQVSKLIESHLNREEEDFELEVSSSGISSPFKILEHYKKHLGSEVEVFTTKNKKKTGVLTQVNKENFTIETATLQKVEGKKKKQTVILTTTLAYDEVRSTRLVIKFK